MAPDTVGGVKYSEFWDRLDTALGVGFAQVWAQTHVMSRLGGRTARQALDAGLTPKEVWAIVWAELELPATLR